MDSKETAPEHTFGIRSPIQWVEEGQQIEAATDGLCECGCGCDNCPDDCPCTSGPGWPE